MFDQLFARMRNGVMGLMTHVPKDLLGGYLIAFGVDLAFGAGVPEVDLRQAFEEALKTAKEPSAAQGSPPT